jgi:peptidoglycan/xylan/chitin deacetylase (PgdA/CDA1 family)
MDFAWTVDDGASAGTVNAFLRMMSATGTRMTFCPTHLFARNWEWAAAHLRTLIGQGQAQLVNHTWSHRTLTTLSDHEVREEVQRNEDWIQRTFQVTSRPWLRPPQGRWDARVGDLCGELGFTRMLLWDSSFGDASAISSAALMANAERALFPGAIALGHANVPTVALHLTEVLDLIRARGLRPATLDEVFGTSRTTG